MGHSKRRTIRAIMATDSTFSRVSKDPDADWRGKCIHCRRWLYVAANGEPVSRATIEHILPKSHGGSDELSNLALACARCNHQKGMRHDVRRPGDPKLMEIVERLREERERRWREPDPNIG